MNIPINIIVKDICFITLTSISGSVMWQMCKDIYNSKVNNFNYKIRNLKDMTNLNFGLLFGFGLGISYIYTGKPLIYNFIK